MNDDLAAQFLREFVALLDDLVPGHHGKQKELYDELTKREPILAGIAEEIGVDAHWMHHYGSRASHRGWQHTREVALHVLGLVENHRTYEQIMSSPAPRLTADELHPWVWRAASSLWETGHRRTAVHAVATSVNARIQTKVDRRDVSDARLVRESFSLMPPKPGRPRLRIAPDDGSETYRSLQEGALSLGVGCFKALRNIAAHEHHEAELSEQEGLEQLATFSVFARLADRASVLHATDTGNDEDG